MTANATVLERNFSALQARIRGLEREAGRAAGSVRVVAVSKLHPAGAVRCLAGLGQRAFGENYFQEAVDKRAQLADLALEWHFIGHVQGNKTRGVAENFSWVHSVDKIKTARRLSVQRPAQMPPLNVCLQVNVDGERSKFGAAADEVDALAHAVAELPRLALRGLMAIPKPQHDPALQRRGFATLRGILESLRAGGLPLDTLSMGMSDDLAAAIAEGATQVRIGTALFGPRPDPMQK